MIKNHVFSKHDGGRTNLAICSILMRMIPLCRGTLISNLMDRIDLDKTGMRKKAPD